MTVRPHLDEKGEEFNGVLLSEGVSAYTVFVWETSLPFASTGLFGGGVATWDLMLMSSEVFLGREVLEEIQETF